MESLLFLSLLCCVVVNAQTEAADPEFCTRESQGTLESRVNQADVVITGTVIRVETEHRAPWDFMDGNWPETLSEPAKPRPGSQPVGLVKLWRVVKGSLAQVANQTSGPQDLLSYDDTDNSVLDTPILKLYGVWNDELCGSYVTTGDTRIFFLKKYPDFRNIMDTNLRSVDIESDNESFDLPTDLSIDIPDPERMAAPGVPELVPSAEPLITGDSEEDEKLELVETHSSISTLNNTISNPGSELQAVEKKKKPGKKKKDKGKKKKKKKRGGKKKRKSSMSSITTKSVRKPKKKGRKKAARAKRKSSESGYGEWKRLIGRPKRSIGLINKASPRNMRGGKVRRDAGPRSVLVLYSPPARITLANLNGVEDIAKYP